VKSESSSGQGAAASADECYKWQVPGSSRTGGGGEDGIERVQTKPRAVKVQQLSIGSDSDRIKRTESLRIQQEEIIPTAQSTGVLQHSWTRRMGMERDGAGADKQTNATQCKTESAVTRVNSDYSLAESCSLVTTENLTADHGGEFEKPPASGPSRAVKQSLLLRHIVSL
jgi:hypothetical protein